MRRFLIILCVLFAIVLSLVLFVLLGSGKREQRLKDGSIVRIEKVAFGKEEHIKPGGPLQKFKDAVTQFWRSKFPGKGPTSGGGMSSWYMNATIRSNEPALYVYVTRRDPIKGYRSVDAPRAAIIDADGCVFVPTQSGGWDDGTLGPFSAARGGNMHYSVGWFRFEAFPRRDKKFRFQMHNDRKPGGGMLVDDPDAVELNLANPLAAPGTANWSPEPLPVVRVQGSVSFALTNVSVQTNAARNGYLRSADGLLKTGYKITEDGRPSTNWQSSDEELYDATGNFVAEQYAPVIPLCPREPVWKLRVKFFGDEHSHAASNAVWALPPLTVPEPGKYVAVNSSQVLQGIHLTVGTFGGSGIFTYSNAIALTAEDPKEPVKHNNSAATSYPNNWRNRGSIAKPTYTLRTMNPHLAIEVDALGDDQRLTARAVDDQGREFYGHKVNDYNGWHAREKSQKMHYLSDWGDYEGSFIIFDLPDDAKTVNVTFCVHTGRTAEFIFKPPQPEARLAR